LLKTSRKKNLDWGEEDSYSKETVRLVFMEHIQVGEIILATERKGPSYYT